ncbi:conserved protein of unknown function (plasmid) [Paraburkholderia kururiensis]|uniref:hypothetical protein n=1 Tax=Paraburkholderia kururiensis TaxID=984307 RepID=UPI0039A4C312
MNTLKYRVLRVVATRGRHTALHAGVVTLIITAVFMMVTAGDLGPLGPLIIAASFYAVFAAVVIELVLGLFALGRWLARRGLGKCT